MNCNLSLLEKENFKFQADARYEVLNHVMDSIIWMPNGFYPIRVNQKVQQIHCVDWIDARSGMRVDDKSRVIYNPNWGLANTFPLEVFTANNKGGVGWLYHDDSWATHYAFIAARARDPAWSAFTEIKAYLCDVNDIYAFLDNLGFVDMESCIGILSALGRIYMKGSDVYLEYEAADGVVIRQNKSSYEHPINIWCRTDVIERFASAVYEWNPTAQ